MSVLHCRGNYYTGTLKLNLKWIIVYCHLTGEFPTNSTHHTHFNQDLCLGSPSSCFLYGYTQASYICIILHKWLIITFLFHSRDRPILVHNMWQTNTSRGCFSLSWDLEIEIYFVRSQNKVRAFRQIADTDKWGFVKSVTCMNI